MRFKIYEYKNDFRTVYKTHLVGDVACLWEHEVEVKESSDYELGYTVLDVPCITYEEYTYEIDELIRCSNSGNLYLQLWTPKKGYRRINVNILSTKEISTTFTMEEMYGQ